MIVIVTPYLRYMALLEAQCLVPAALTSTKACDQLQAQCAASNDWRFRFGAVAVLMDVVQHTQDAGVRSMAVRGACAKGA